MLVFLPKNRVCGSISDFLDSHVALIWLRNGFEYGC